jgi:hypothetical protein
MHNLLLPCHYKYCSYPSFTKEKGMDTQINNFLEVIQLVAKLEFEFGLAVKSRLFSNLQLLPYYQN